METWIDIGGVRIAAPVTAFTNLLLAVQCAVYWRHLGSERSKRALYWSLFFLAMAGATLAGVPKHGLKHVLPTDAYSWVLWASSLGSAASVYFAQRATLASRSSSRFARHLLDLCRVEAAAFVGASLVLGPEMWLVVVNTAVGLAPVIAAEARAWWRGSMQAGRIATGLGVSLGTGVVYLTELSAGPWLNHIDIAHLLMGVSFFFIVRGAPARVGPGGAVRTAPVGDREARASLVRGAEEPA